jgi:hypothetical protein
MAGMAGKAPAVVASLMSVGDHWWSRLAAALLSWCKHRCDWYYCQSESESVRVPLQLTVGQSVSQSVHLDIEPHCGLMTRCFFLFESYSSVHMRCPLWREDGSVVCQSDTTILEVRVLILLSLVVSRRHMDKWALELPWWVPIGLCLLASVCEAPT